ncbi:MAG: transcription elongation factor GreA [Chloroflexota bacterium]|jgi:transcription elongation factor GreA|nr:transcription elongation factor GreA [Chloroflexota bacterium]
MSQRKNPVTREGYDRLQEELRELTEVRRPQVIAAVAEARSHGDLRENSAYDAARHDQAMTEKRIADIEHMLRSATILEEDEIAREPGVVGLGSTVVVDFDGEDERYTIVGAIEARPAQGLISNESPIGKALIGKRAGDRAVVTAPGGETSLTIKSVV